MMMREGSEGSAAALSNEKNARLRKNGVLRFRLITLSQAASGKSAKLAPQLVPELLTKMCNLDSLAATWAANSKQPNRGPEEVVVSYHC
jgi:hypothetical protein